MVLAPFISVIMTFCLIYAFVWIYTDAAGGDMSAKAFGSVIGFMFPFFLLTSFASSAGVYTMNPIMERNPIQNMR